MAAVLAGSRRLSLSILASFLASTGAQAADVSTLSLWSTPLGMPGEAKFAAADLNGDGIDEVVGIGSRFQGHPMSSSALSVQGFDPQGDWRIFQLTFIDEPRLNGVVVGRRAGGDIVVTVVTRIDGAGTFRYSLEYLEGLPLVSTRTVPLASYRWPEALQDVDADGDLDLLSQGTPGPPWNYHVEARDLASDQLLWSYPVGPQERLLRLAQLDGDAPLELVVSRTPGEIVDGRTGQLEWSWAGGFGATAPGDFDASHPLVFADGNLGNLTFFRAPPYAAVETYEVNGDPAFGVNIDADSDEELALTNGSGVQFFERRDLDGEPAIVRNLRLDNMYIREASLAELDGDPLPEVLALESINRPGSSGGGWGAVFDPLSGAALADFWNQPYDALPILVGPLDETGNEQVALFSMVAGGITQAGVQLVDAASGNVARRSGVLRQLAGGAPPAFAWAQLDADPQAEIVLGRRTDIESGFIALDGKSLKFQLFGPAPTNFWFPRAAQDVEIVDLDADGQLEVLIVDDDQAQRVRVLDASTGAVEWQSPAISDGIVSIHPFQADADPALELLAWTGSDMHVFDGATHALEWGVDTTRYGSLFAYRDRGGCRIGVASAANFGGQTASLASFDCRGNPLGEISMPAIQGSNPFFAVRDGVGYTFADGRLQRVPMGSGVATPISAPVGPSAGNRQDSVLIRDVDAGVFDVFFANDGKVERLRVTVPELFIDGFE